MQISWKEVLRNSGSATIVLISRATRRCTHTPPHCLTITQVETWMSGTDCVVSDEGGSFYDRKPTIEFKPPTPDWGYLAQVNEKFKSVLTWEVERIVGEPAHRAMFRCTPGRPSLPTVVCVPFLTPKIDPRRNKSLESL